MDPLLLTLLIFIALVAVYGVAYRIQVEEALLAAEFGEEWHAYVARTRWRMIPWVL